MLFLNIFTCCVIQKGFERSSPLAISEMSSDVLLQLLVYLTSYPINKSHLVRLDECAGHTALWQ